MKNANIAKVGVLAANGRDKVKKCPLALASEQRATRILNALCAFQFPMIKASFQHFAEPRWERVKPLRVGCASTGLGTPDAFVLVENDGAPFIRVDVYGDEDCYAFEDVIVWREFVVIGFGVRVHMINYQTQETITFELDSYFGHFYPGDEWLIIASGYRLLLIGPTGSVVWKTENLGLDGVIIDSIKGNLIHGQGEWDPPGGWRPFQVRLDTGEKIFEP